MDIIKTLALKINKKYALLFITGLWCAALQSSLELPLPAFVSYAPLMYFLSRFESRRDLAKSFASFFIPYYFYQFAFLLTVYPQIDLVRPLAVLLLLLAVIALTLWESLLMLLAVYLYTYLRKDRIYDLLTLAVLIAAGEWLQESFPVLSFPWCGVWLSVTGEPLVIQPANLLGCRVVTVLLLTVNGFAAYALTACGKKRLAAVCSAAAVYVLWFGYGFYSAWHAEKLSQDSESIIAVVAQDEAEGNKKTACTAWDCARAYRRIINSSMIEKADIVVLPETAVPMGYDSAAGEFSVVSGIAKSCKATVINGCFFRFDGDEYNALYAVDCEGNVSEPYFKQVLVPFGEKIPFAALFGSSTLCECSDDVHTKPLETALGKVGCAICIESVYAETVRKQAADGAQILCVCTNDSWFGKSSARNVHFRHSIMRAAENGKYLLRSGNCGISAIIKPTGEVQSVRTQTSKGVVTGEVRLIEERTLYSRFKDLFTIFPAALAALAVIKMYKLSPKNNEKLI